MRGHEMNKNAVEPEHVAELSLAEFCCAPGDRVEHGLDVGRRTRDYAQYLARGGLVFEGLLKLAFTCLLRLKQARVLNGDYGLVGEGLEQVDLPGHDRPGVAPGHDDHPNHVIPAQHWCAKQPAPPTCVRVSAIVTWILKRILQQNNALCEHNSATNRAQIGYHRPIGRCARQRFRRPVLGCHDVKQPAIEPEHRRELAVTEPTSILKYRLEYRVHIGGRAADDSEDVRGRGLSLKRLLRLVEEPRVLDGDNR